MSNTRKIRVLVVEDSPTVREQLVHIVNAAPDMEVVATAADGEEAVEAVRRVHPDVVTMDIFMPRLDGLEATREIMRECPVPIVVISSMPDSEVSASFRALEAGALAFARKPAPDDPRYLQAMAEMIETVRLMSEVKVVRRAGMRRAAVSSATAGEAIRQDIKAIAIGASTGGPGAIVALLKALPHDIDAPILIVQHITTGFLDGFVRWLGEATGHRAHIAVDQEPLLPGHVYLAPDGCHLGIDRQGHVELSDVAPEFGLRPAVSYMFRSVREIYGRNAAGVLLSGMGKDGAAELRDLREAGALTFAQDAGSALVFGMPGEAVRLKAARHILDPTEIGTLLAGAVGRQ